MHPLVNINEFTTAELQEMALEDSLVILSPRPPEDRPELVEFLTKHRIHTCALFMGPDAPQQARAWGWTGDVLP